MIYIYINKKMEQVTEVFGLKLLVNNKKLTKITDIMIKVYGPKIGIRNRRYYEWMESYWKSLNIDESKIYENIKKFFRYNRSQRRKRLYHYKKIFEYNTPTLQDISLVHIPKEYEEDLPYHLQERYKFIKPIWDNSGIDIRTTFIHIQTTHDFIKRNNCIQYVAILARIILYLKDIKNKNI